MFIISANLLLVCGCLLGFLLFSDVVRWSLRNLALFLCVVLYKWTSIANKNYVTLLCLRPGAFRVSFGSATGKRIGKKTCVFRLPQLSFPTNLPSALWYILVGARHIRRLSSVRSCLTSEIFAWTHAVRSKTFRLGGEDVSDKWENKKNGWSPVMHTL